MQVLVVWKVAIRVLLQSLKGILFTIAILNKHFLTIKLVFEPNSLIQSLFRSLLFLPHNLVLLVFLFNLPHILHQQLRLLLPLSLESFDSCGYLILILYRISL